MARKVTILARQCGLDVELDSVPVQSLVPASLQDWGPADGEVLADAFVAQMQAFDEEKASGLPRLPAAPARPPARLGATVSHC